VLAENEDVLAKIGWPPNSVEMGFAAGDSDCQYSRYTGGGVIVSVTGSTPEQMMPYIADAVGCQTGWEIIFTVGGLSLGTLRPALVLSPILAQTIARAGWSKDDVKRYLFDHARMACLACGSADGEGADFPIASLEQQVHLGRSRGHFTNRNDPNRLVPDCPWIPTISWSLVSGDRCGRMPTRLPRTVTWAFRWPGRL